MNALLTATLVAAAIVVLVVLYLGYKYPKGWSDWPHDRTTTYRYVISAVLFLLILGLIYWVTRIWDYPTGARGLAYIAFIAIGILFVLGMVFPKGMQKLRL
jgi:hypothetical protein